MNDDKGVWWKLLVIVFAVCCVLAVCMMVIPNQTVALIVGTVLGVLIFKAVGIE